MTHIQQRRDTTSNWVLLNPILMEGEAGHETDSGRWKLGDGVTAWIDLPYKMGVDSVAGRTGDVDLTVEDVDGAAPLVSPSFTGLPESTTPNTADNGNRIATTAFVKNLAYAPKDSPVFTGNPTAPTPNPEDDDASIATTGFVKDQGYAPLVNAALTGTPTAPTPPPTSDDTSIATTGFVKDVIAREEGTIAYDVNVEGSSSTHIYRDPNWVVANFEFTPGINFGAYVWSMATIPAGFRSPVQWEVDLYTPAGAPVPCLLSTDGFLIPRVNVAAGTTVLGSGMWPRA